MELLPFKLAEGQGDRPVISVQYKGEEKQFSALEISSMILRKMRETAEGFLGCPIKNAVISVPACFNELQRRATLDAATIAGLKVMCILNEPTAAAIACGLDHKNDGFANKNVLIFDLGGGTLDVSVLTMDMKRGHYEVKATEGDVHLGGVDFDNRLIRHCIEVLNREHGKELKLDPKALAKLRRKCEEAKIMLSSITEVDLQIDSLLKGIDFYHLITLSKFEELNKHLFDRCIEIVDNCLRGAKMYRSSIHEVILIWGSTRIPKIKQLLQDFFDGKNLNMRINSDEAVACGATIQAAILSVNSKVPRLKVREIVTHSLGIVKHGELIFMLRRNEAIQPARKMPLTAEKKDITISVYEGESTRINENNLLGLWTLKPISFRPNGIVDQFHVFLKIDENGFFSFSSENNVEMHCENTMPILSRKEIDKMAADAEDLKIEEDRYKKNVEAKNALETLVDHFFRSIEKNTDQSELGNGNEKLLIETMRRTREWLENNPQAVGDTFDEEYKEYVSQLKEALSSPGVRSRCYSSSITGTGGLKINSDMEFARLVSEFSGVDLWHIETSPTSTQGHRTLLDHLGSNAE